MDCGIVPEIRKLGKVASLRDCRHQKHRATKHALQKHKGSRYSNAALPKRCHGADVWWDAPTQLVAVQLQYPVSHHTAKHYHLRHQKHNTVANLTQAVEAGLSRLEWLQLADSRKDTIPCAQPHSEREFDHLILYKVTFV